MIEKEYKWLVEKEDFLQMIHYFSKNYKCKIIEQKNYYYDSKDFYLDKNNITLRVREKNGKCVMQTKQSEKEQARFKISIETKVPIHNVPEKILSREVDLFVDRCFEYLGALRTKRYRFYLDENTTLDCDESFYLGYVDYEIEMEFIDKPAKFILALFKDYPFNSISKCKRFLKKIDGEK